MKKLLLATVTVMALGVADQAWAAPVAITLTATYNTVTASGSGDFQTQCCSTDLGMVTSTLGPDGLPVYTGVSTFPLLDINPVTKEIEWWTPGTTAGGDVVTSSGTGMISSPFASTNMYPPTGPNGNVGNDSGGFLTAEFTGTFDLPTASKVTFTLGSDDDSFFYVDGTLVTGLGGVHGDTPAPTNTVTLSAGLHTIELFYDDRYQTQAALNFGLDSTGIVPVPEPISMSLLGVGLLGLGMARRRRA